MKKINNWDKQQAVTQREQLPVGGYVAKIMGAEEKEYGFGNMLWVSVDIAEGEYANYYAEDYRSQDREDKKWHGVVRLFVPKDDGSEKDEWTKKSFKSFTNAVEDSNSGYAWDWDETKLKGKEIGVLVRNEEWENTETGKSGWKTQPFMFIASDDARQGNYSEPKDKPLKNRQTAPVHPTNQGFADMPIDDDLPFI